MIERPRINLDSDGTLTLGPPSSTGKLAPIRTGTRRFLQALRSRGYEVVVHTAYQPISAVREHYRQAGLLPLIAEVTSQKLPAKLQVDDRAVVFRGNYDDALKQIDTFQPHWELGTKHRYANVSLPIPLEIASKIKSIATSLPEEDIDPEDGREERPHLTLKYGIDSDVPDGAKRALSNIGPIRIKLAKLGIFEIPDRRDVLKFTVESGDAAKANEAICKECPHVDTFAIYEPHVTVSYLKSGKGKSHVWPTDLDGTELTLTRAVFQDRNGNEESIPLA